MIKLGKLKISYDRGRQVFLFLFCLFLAFIIWSIHKFSADYSIYLNYRVHVITSLEGRASEASSSNLLTLKGRASGFYILQKRLLKDESSINIEVDRRLLKRSSSINDGYFILSTDIRDKLSESLEEDFQIEHISVDTLFFKFPRQINRKVPVAATFSVTFKDQYMAVGKIKMIPDTVTLYGNYSLIQSIDSVRTDRLNFENLRVSKNGAVKLKEIPGVRFSQDEVYYTLEVERYVEKSITLPVGVINAPSDVSIDLFPTEVKMSYRIPFNSVQKTVEEDFKLDVDYNDIINSINSFVEPKLENVPREFLSYRFDPQFIECRIIEKSNQ